MQDAITLPAGGASARALSAEQKETWERGGYLILPQFFGADVIDPVNALIERLSEPSARRAELAGRVVVDMLAGPARWGAVRAAGTPGADLPRARQVHELILGGGAIPA